MGDSLTFFGTGTSSGVPMLGCTCRTCMSADSRDKRLRASAYVEYQGLKILIDAGPDFRYQMLRGGATHLDAILLTHNHKDHTGGLDDIRALNYFERRAFPIYCEEYVQRSLHKEYSYAFEEPKYPGAPDFSLITIDERPFEIQGRQIIPVRALHYKLPVLGFRFGKMAYITDASHIDEAELSKLHGLDVLVINSVRMEKHISHFSLPEALEVIAAVSPRQAFITHLSHQFPPHAELDASLPDGVHIAYDGLRVEVQN